MTLVLHDSGTPGGSGSCDVVLLHAFPCDASMWDGQVAGLVAAGHRVLVPDLPGFGSSELPGGDPSLAVVAAELSEALSAAGVRQYAVAGLSLGGYVVMELLRADPQRLLGIALIDTKASADADSARLQRLATAAEVLAWGDTERLVAVMLPGLLGESARRGNGRAVEATAGWIRAAAPESVAWYQTAMAARPDSVVELAHFPRPSLVVWGEEDLVLSPRAEAERMAAALPDGQLVTVPAAGHLSAVEQPSVVTDALVGWLSRIRLGDSAD